MKQLEEIHPPVTPFERQTGNCPLLMATAMLDQLKNYFWTELPDDLADEVAAKAEVVFAGNEYWRKKFLGRRGEEYLEMFLRHWFASALFKRKSPLFRQLPPEFKIGAPLPKVSLPRQQMVPPTVPAPVLQQDSPLPENPRSPEKFPSKTIRKRGSRPFSRYLHGCELLSA